MIVDYRVEITRFDGTTVTLKRLILSISIDRRIGMGTASASILISNTEDLINFHGWNGVIDNYNAIKIYIENKIQFCGEIRSYNIKDDNRTIEINCLDNYTKLLKCVDPGVPFLTYNNIKATDLIIDLARRAGIEEIIIHPEGLNDYIIEKLKIRYDTQYSDVIDEVLAVIRGRARCAKDGKLIVERLFPFYADGDVANNRNYNWYYEAFKKLQNASAGRTTDTLYSRLLVRYNEKEYDVFEDDSMIHWARGEKRFKEIDSPFATTREKRHLIASRFFLDRWRENTKFDVISTKGNPDLDLGDICRIKLDSVFGHYMAVAIKTEITSEGNYIDQISCEGMRGDYLTGVLSSGDYTVKEDVENG